MAISIGKLLLKMNEVGASDLHIKIGSPPVLRIASALHRVESPNLTAEDTVKLLDTLIPEGLKETLHELGGLDFSHMEGPGARYRCSVFHAGGGLHAAIRRVNPSIPSFDDLHLPPIYHEVADKTHEGLVVVCGVTGCGKSTTLAAMVDHINHSRPCNIITIEDPVEYLLQPDKSFISQREIGIDTRNFKVALRAALRQDPDVILVGELRDAETISMAMTAAETGHLVLGTLHTTGAVKTIDRIIDALPGELREQTKAFLAMSLKAVVPQVLVKTPDGRGRRAVFEILVNTRAISKLITTDQTHQIGSQLQTGKDYGMQMMDQSLLDAINAKEVDPDDAYRYATDKRKFQRFVTNTDLVPTIDVAGENTLNE